MNLLSVSSLITAIVYIYLGVQVLQKDRRASINQAFAVLCLSLAFWAFFYSFVYSGSLENKAELFKWHRLSSIGYTTFPAIILHFSMVLVGISSRLNKNKWRLLILLIYCPAAILLYQSMTGTLFVYDFKETSFGMSTVVDGRSFWFLFYNIYLLICMSLMLLFVYRWGRRSFYRREKTQSRIIVVSGIFVLLSGFATNLAFPALDYEIPALAPIITIIWAIGTWVSIEKYKLMSLHFGMAAEQILETVKDYLALIDREGNIIKANLVLKNEINGGESISSSPMSWIFYEKELFEEYLSPLKTGGEPEGSRELHLITSNKDEHLIPIRIYCSPVYDRSADLIGAVVTGHDLRPTRQLQEQIREKTEAEIELRRSYEKLKELDKLKTDFLSSVSHELRTPLTSILGFASTSKKRFEKVLLPHVDREDKKAARAVRQVQENLDIIISEGQRLTNLINEVLDIAKMEAGRIEWKEDKFDLQQVVQNALAATRPLFQQKGLFLTTDLEADLPPLYGDKDRIYQVFINLLSNGMKFTEEGGITVYVAANHDNGEIMVRVTDTGIGIKPAEQDRVFDKFRQVGDTLTDKPQGTGLGLSICKEIVEHHGGQIWVESVPGQGCSFCFTLPFKQPQGKALQPQQDPKNLNPRR